MQALDYLRELIAFPSVSSESNVAVTDQAEEWLQRLGFETERVNYSDARGVLKSNVVGRRGPATGAGLAWFGHTDVVPVTSWSCPGAGPWSAEVRDARVYGRGACDMKGPVACMLAAAALVHTPLRAPLWIVLTADEEVGMHGARRVAAQSQLYREIVAARARAIIGEPTCLRVVYAHKGGRTLRAVSRGRAAHSSTGLGINANFALIPFLQEAALVNHQMEHAPEWRDERFTPPTPTMNLLITDPNTASNITSARSECTLYFRPMPGQQVEGVVQRLRECAERHGLEFDVVFSGEPLFTPPNAPFVRELMELSGTKTAETVAYGTDGAVLTELTCPVVFGPGDIAQAHTDDEWISLEQLERGTQLYHEAIKRWCIER
ncbi:MAG: Acetylornithine deacetylase [Planctomycetota bacterium]|jgi:acetylornithine deacetylase